MIIREEEAEDSALMRAAELMLVAYGIPLSISGKNPFFDRLAK